MAAETQKYFRHRQTGDRGRLFYEGVAPFMQYDRPSGAKIPYRENDWIEEVDAPPLSRGQIARIAFAADRQFLYFTASYAKAKREWTALTDDERIHWNEKGPGGKNVDPKRVELYQKIMATLDPLTRAP